MTAQDYIQEKLDTLKLPLDLREPENTDELAEAIFHLLMSKRFRKYSANSELVEHIKNATRLSIENDEPLKLVFTQGAYKLWRLEESPEADWAELFCVMYYTQWLSPICEIYRHGVWIDFFVDDLILSRLNDVNKDESDTYRNTFQVVIDFMEQYRPSNLKMTITGVSEQFASKEAFYDQLDKDTEKYARNFAPNLPEVDERDIAMIELNTKPNAKIKAEENWMQKSKLIHDAYLTHTKAETAYHNRTDKIKVFSQPLGSGMFLAPGTTKDSVAKHWAGVGALLPKDDSYRQIILTPKQLENAHFEWEDIDLGINGKNFNRIRVLEINK